MTAAMAFFSIALTLNIDGSSSDRFAGRKSAADGSALVHGTTADHGFDAHYPLLRPFAAGVRSGIADEGTAAHDTGRRHGEPAATEWQHSRRRESQNRVRLTRMEVLAWTLRNSRASQRPKGPLTIWKHPSRFRTGPRIPAAPQKQYGKGAQYGLRKSQWSQCNGLLPELRQGALRGLCSQCGHGRFSASLAPWRGRTCSSHLLGPQWVAQIRPSPPCWE